MCAVVGDSIIDKQWRIKDSNLQSGAVLWLCHSFARAFSGDSVPVDCFAYARNDTRLSLRIIFASLRAHARERGNQQCRVTNTFDCNANARNNAKCANLKHLLLLCGVWHKIALDSEILKSPLRAQGSEV